MKTLSPMGHKFGDDMVCSCGTTWAAHQSERRPCGQVLKSRYTLRPKSGASPVEALRRALSIPVRAVADSCGVSEETARRALTGKVGGKGMASSATANRVEAFVRDIAKGTDGSSQEKPH